LDESGFVGEDDGLDAVAEIELLEDVRDVRLHCRFTQVESAGDFRV
jgi:hypothetical protein